MTRGWRRESGGCGHADVATVTAVSEGWELEGSRLEKRSEEDDIRRIQMHPRSPCWSRVIPNYHCSVGEEGSAECGGCKGLGGGGLYREYRKRGEKKEVYSGVCLNLSERCGTCEVNTHACHRTFRRRRLWQKSSLSAASRETCVRQVKIWARDKFPVKVVWNVCGLQIQLCTHINPCTI